MRREKLSNKSLSKNTKGVEIAWSTIIYATMGALILILLLPTTAQTASNFYKKIFNPDNAGGQCLATCNDGTYQDPNVQCKNNQVYCKPNTPSANTNNNNNNNPNTNPNPQTTKPPSQNNICKNQGQENCNGANTICDHSLACVTLCEYCAKNPSNANCTIDTLDTKKTNVVETWGSEFTGFNSNFKCGCSASKCDDIRNGGASGTCITDLCPSPDPTSNTYMCCTTS